MAIIFTNRRILPFHLELALSDKVAIKKRHYWIRFYPNSGWVIFSYLVKHIDCYLFGVVLQNRQVGRKDVLSRVLWGVVKECQNPEYVVFAELAASNCTKQGKRTYAPNECIAIQERVSYYKWRI